MICNGDDGSKQSQSSIRNSMLNRTLVMQNKNVSFFDRSEKLVFLKKKKIIINVQMHSNNRNRLELNHAFIDRYTHTANRCTKMEREERWECVSSSRCAFDNSHTYLSHITYMDTYIMWRHHKHVYILYQQYICASSIYNLYQSNLL